jgi:hypothetical protein
MPLLSEYLPQLKGSSDTNWTNKKYNRCFLQGLGYGENGGVSGKKHLYVKVKERSQFPL